MIRTNDEFDKNKQVNAVHNEDSAKKHKTENSNNLRVLSDCDKLNLCDN